MTKTTTTNRKATTMSKSTSPALQHADGCPDGRIEIIDYPDQKLTTYHCLDCAAHLAVRADGSIQPAPWMNGPFNTTNVDPLGGVTMETGTHDEHPDARRIPSRPWLL